MPTRFHPELDEYVQMSAACALAAAYVVLGLAGNRFMASREPLQLTIPKLLYNSTQVVACSITFAKLLPFFTSAEHGYGVGIVSQATVEFWVFVYYCCKVLDFCDTLFMVLGKKTRQFTLLHVWHHASIVPLFGYYLSTGMGGGFIAALPLWNSLVHVIMYSHYLVTSIFTFKRMWWKPIITASQMGHHMLIMMYMILNRVYENPECTWAVCIYAVLWGFSILGLFAHFFLQSYLSPKSAKQGGDAKPKAS